MAVLIVKSYKFVLLPKELSASSSSMKDLIQASQQDAVRSTLITYFQTLSARLVKEVSAMNHLEISNQESSIAKGFLSDERKEKMDKAQKLVEKLTVSTQTLAQGLGQVMPDLPKLEDAAVKHHGVTIVDTGLSFAAANEAANNFWENEETRTFYTDIPDLKNLVPPACLDIVDAAQATDDPSKSVAALLESTLSGDLADPTGLEDDLADSTEPTVSQFDSVMAMLQGTVMNREIIDQVAIDFALVNSKGTKKRLAKFIVDSHRKRSDLIPYLARLLAILNPYIPDVGALVLQPVLFLSTSFWNVNLMYWTYRLFCTLKDSFIARTRPSLTSKSM